MRSWLAATLVAAGLLTAACNGVVDPSNNVLQTFTGTIPVQGTTVPGAAWSTNKTGEYMIKVTAMDPNNGVYFGTILSYAAGNGTCVGQLQPIQQNSFGTVNTPVMSGAIYPGSYCVFLFDVGFFTVPENFTLTVSHP
jgi:hypothetical protein